MKVGEVWLRHLVCHNWAWDLTVTPSRTDNRLWLQIRETHDGVIIGAQLTRDDYLALRKAMDKHFGITTNEGHDES